MRIGRRPAQPFAGMAGSPVRTAVAFPTACRDRFAALAGAARTR